MELKIYSPTEDGFIKAIEWNHAEIKKEVAEKVSYYANLVYTDDQIKDAKADRAKLNKFVQALEAKRKEVKKQCLAPYESFEKQMKEIIAIVNEPIKMIDQQVKGYEEQKKAEKLDAIKNYWNSCTPPFTIKLEQLFDSKWLNASVSMKSIQTAIDEKIVDIESDLATLQNLSEFSFEAIEVYKSTLDLGMAIQEGKRLSDIQKIKMEHEAEMERQKAETVKSPDGGVYVQDDDKQGFTYYEPATSKEWIGFKALLTTEDALALKEFFESRNIQFEASGFTEKEIYLVSKVFQNYYCMGIDEIAEKNENAKSLFEKIGM